MKLFLAATLVVVALTSSGNAVPQSFLSDLANRFANTFRGGNPRPPRQSRPPQNFRPNAIHNQFSQPPQQQHFNSQPTFHHQQQQPVVHHHQQQQHHQSHHQQQHHHQPSSVVHHQPQQSHHHGQQPQHIHFSDEPQTVSFKTSSPETVSSFSSQPVVKSQPKFTHGCAHATVPNHSYDGKDYILTFLNGCSNFTGQEADSYCVANGGRAVSLDTTAKANHFHNVIAQHAQRYFWTGGRIDHNAGVVTWPSGNREGYTHGQRFWSYTGGSDPNRDIPQPDNRDGNEVCIGVLNNFYADGIKWHDVSCHHRKPTICELN